MYPSGRSPSIQNSRMNPSEKVDSVISHRINMVSLAILFVGLFSCLIRSDYNFAIVFLLYFIWQQRKDLLALKIILASTIILFIFDILFAIIQIRVWTTEDTNNNIWQTLRPMHNFGIFCYTLIMILKVILVVLALQGISKINKAVQAI